MILWLPMGLVGIWLVGCEPASPDFESLSRGFFSIAPEFEAYYRKVGGEEVLGAPISPRLEEGEFVYQYLANALLFSARNESGSAEVGFVPIGLDLSLPSPWLTLGVGRSQEVADSLPIHREFLPLYEKLGGRERVGKPLSGLRYNPRYRRYEQFFEGVGMYRAESDPPGEARLLAYGAWKCGEVCQYPFPIRAVVSSARPIDLRAAPLVERLGVDLTGFPLLPAIREADGDEIVIFENVALEIKANSESRAKLAPLPRKLGIFPERMVDYQESEETVFIAREDNRGYPVLRSFLNYIETHGGVELIGLPISGPIREENANVRQCFETLCLIEDRQIEGIYRIRPIPLGFEYASLYHPSELEEEAEARPSSRSTLQPSGASASEQDASSPGQEVTLQIFEARPFVDQQTQQEIGVIVSLGQQPVVNLRPKLVLSLSSGETLQLEMPPTDQQGRSSIAIPPLQAPNGTLVDYRVCVVIQGKMELCAREDYLIWSP